MNSNTIPYFNSEISLREWAKNNNYDNKNIDKLVGMWYIEQCYDEYSFINPNSYLYLKVDK
jgi:hypothetical protein